MKMNLANPALALLLRTLMFNSARATTPEAELSAVLTDPDFAPAVRGSPI